ncbi:class I SAM-dependent methyltransferase [Candidatus Microgenomates bacterium]|nr:class I SAM-dependent methyltransferase [Candidatus Microgenomates bacterium]
MGKHSSLYYSQLFPPVLAENGKRVANQIMACLRFVAPKHNFAPCKLLDVGSSNGRTTVFLSSFVRKAIGVDVDESAISWGKKNYHNKKLRLYVFDGKSIHYPDQTFDLVIFRLSYWYAEDQEKLVSEIFRVLKKGGLVFFEGHNKLYPFDTDYKLPFLPYLPSSWAKLYINMFSNKPYFARRYKTYWGLKQLFSSFQITPLTPNIIKNPKAFQFKKLYNLAWIGKVFPLWLLRFLEPLSYDLIWVLRKPAGAKSEALIQ